VPDDIKESFGIEESDKDSDHLNFVRKVLGIVAAQMTTTMSLCLWSSYDD